MADSSPQEYNCSFNNGQLQHFINGDPVSEQVAIKRGFKCPLDSRKLSSLVPSALISYDPLQKKYLEMVSDFSSSYSQATSEAAKRIKETAGSLASAIQTVGSHRDRLVENLKTDVSDNKGVLEDIGKCISGGGPLSEQCKGISSFLSQKELEIKKYIAKISELENELKSTVSKLKSLEDRCKQDSEKCSKMCKGSV